MKVIEKIHIRYFRSIKDQSILKLNDLNIFSGANDTGKSNILKALNLFFKNETDFQKSLDFNDDFSQERLDEARKKSIKAKQFIAVKINFCAPIGHKNLPKKFYVEKTWDRDGHLLNVADNVLSQFKKGKTSAKTEKMAKQALSRFINSIHYEYIPAVRSAKIFENLLNLLQNLILLKQNKNNKINKLLGDINEESKGFTTQVSNDFEKISGIKSNIKIPAEFRSFFKAFFINTETGQFSIPLRLRGDGIQMRYIPTILDYIAKHSRGIFIWGFDEPENSTEYSLCSQMASDFLKIFADNSQIFISTHSFHFTTLHGDRLSKYRVYKDKNGINSLISLIKNEDINLFEDSDIQKVNEELGILDLHKEIAEKYKLWEENKEKWLSEFNDIKKKIDKDETKPILFVEGKTDRRIISLAWEKIHPSRNMPFKIVDAYDRHLLGNTFKRCEIFQNYPDRIFIGMLDFDDGYDNWKKLEESKFYSEVTGRDKRDGLVMKHVNKKGYVFLLPVPDIRKDYADQAFDKSHLSIELLFEDRLLDKFTEDLKLAGGIFIKKMKADKKDSFAVGTKNFKKEDFSNFEPIFKIVDDVLSKKI